MAQVITHTNAWFYPDRPGEFIEVEDTTPLDSDKTLTVPANKVWRILHVNAIVTTSSDVGNRQIELIQADSSGNEIARSDAFGVQIKSTTEFYEWSIHHDEPTEKFATEHDAPLPLEWMPPGYTMEILDSAAIDPDGDTEILRLIALEYETN